MKMSLSALLTFGRNNFYGLADQLLLSTTNFLTIVILARWSTSEVVGNVAFIVNLLTFFMLGHKSISNAFTVFMTSEQKEKHISHCKEFISLHFPIIGIIACCLVSLPFFVFAKINGNYIIFIMSVLFIGTSLIYESQRRIMWAFDSGHTAIKLAVLQSLIFVITFLIIKNMGIVLTLGVALTWLTSARIISIFPLVQNWVSAKKEHARRKKIYIKEYWNFGRWILLRSVLSYLAGNIYIPMVSLLLGFSKAGEFEVGRQLIAPFYILPMGFSSFLLPKLSQLHKELLGDRFNKHIFNLFIVWSSVFFTLAVFLVISGKKILEIVIGTRAQYYDIDNGFLILAILGFAISLNIFCEIIIAAIKKPELGWKPMRLAALANGVIGIPLVLKFGVVGAFAGNAFTSLIAAILILRTIIDVPKIEHR
jgi:O-antigen/teichoic acid export membrane protein